MIFNKMITFVRKSPLRRNIFCRNTYNKIQIRKVHVVLQTCVALDQVLLMVIKYHKNNIKYNIRNSNNQ